MKNKERADEMNALSTAVIALAAVLSLMDGFYFNLASSKTNMIKIIFLELLLLFAIVMFILRIKEGIKNEAI